MVVRFIVPAGGRKNAQKFCPENEIGHETAKIGSYGGIVEASGGFFLMRSPILRSNWARGGRK